MRHLLEGGGEQFLFVVAEYVAERAVDLQPAPLDRDERHADGREVERAAEQFLALLQSFDALLDLAHLRDGAAQVFHVSAVGVVGHRQHGCCADGRVEADEAEQDGE